MTQVGWTVDLSQFTTSYTQMLANMPVHSEMISAIRCLRAEGIKTALLTNNFDLPNMRPLPLMDASLFDVVSTLQLTRACLIVHYSCLLRLCNCCHCRAETGRLCGKRIVLKVACKEQQQEEDHLHLGMTILGCGQGCHWWKHCGQHQDVHIVEVHPN